MKTITLREYESCETELLTFTQAEQIRTHFGRYLNVERSWRGSGWQLRADHYVGTLVLDDLHITILPKTPVTNLFYMLTYAYQLPQFRKEETLVTIGDDIFEFIVRIFLNQTQMLLRQGIYRSYVEQDDAQPYLRGRLLLADHLRHHTVHVGRLVQRTNEHTSDVQENQILKYTLWLLTQLDYRQPTLVGMLRRAYTMFGEVSHVVSTAADCRRIHFTRLNERYHPPIQLAALLLRHLSLESGRGHERFFSYLFDMNLLFEQFVGRYLQEAFHYHPTISIALQEKIWLDAERQETGIPDIVMKQNDQTLCVLDTKYKQFNGSPDPRDRDQMWVYSQRLRAKAGILIYPNAQAQRYHATYEDIPLYVKSFALTGSLHEFQVSCQRFVEEVTSEAISASSASSSSFPPLPSLS